VEITTGKMNLEARKPGRNLRKGRKQEIDRLGTLAPVL
jgi:hypothetical protein